ncbi:MAG: VOC family protein, partial [Acidimicrobiales bacterium]
MSRLSLVSLLVADYDEAVAYYVDALGFTLVEDTGLGGGRRWVVLAPQGSQDMGILLARASTEDQKALIGNQTGGRVFLFLHTDDFESEYERMRTAGVRFVEAPREEPYGRVVVFE